MDQNNDLVNRATELIRYVCTSRDGGGTELGFVSDCLYSTAWVAMIRNPTCPTSLVFPECFDYILARQGQNGGWESVNSEYDSMLNTMAGVLVLKRNKDIAQEQIGEEKLTERTKDAVHSLQSKLESWDIADCDYVAFEIIVPAMLRYLEEEGLWFDFPQRERLMKINLSKLSKIPEAIWKGNVQSSLLFSLEGFCGQRDFSSLSGQKILGGIGGSPASTAAYLMFSTTYDGDAESCLRQILASRKTKGLGGIPNVFPITGFEIVWIMSAFLHNGFSASEIEGMDIATSILNDFCDHQNGLVSTYSKYGAADSDCTGAGIILRKLLGKPPSAGNMVRRFEDKNHFRTYDMERNPSITTNAHALGGLVASCDREKWLPQMHKVTKYLCGAWASSGFSFLDKWHKSEFYCLMTLSEAFVELLRLVEQEGFSASEDLKTLVHEKVLLILVQALMHTLQKQNQCGAWDQPSSREATSYGIIILTNLASLSILPTSIQAQISIAVERGRSYIRSIGYDDPNDTLWVGKTSYCPINVVKAYIIAAMKAPFPKYSLGSTTANILGISEKTIMEYNHIISGIPALLNAAPWKIEGSVVESFFFSRQLKKSPGFESIGKFNRDFDLLALALICTNNFTTSLFKVDLLEGMMEILWTIFIIDQHLGDICLEDGLDIMEMVDEILETIKNVASNGEPFQFQDEASTQDPPSILTSSYSKTLKIKSVITSFLNSQRTDTISAYDRITIGRELCIYLQTRLQSHRETADKKPMPSFRSWLRSSNTVSATLPLLLTLQRCMGKDALTSTALQEYLVADVTMHLNMKFSLRNARESLARRDKETINLLEFSEFKEYNESSASEEITRMIDFEHHCFQSGLEVLGNMKGTNEDLTMFKFVDFFTNIYFELLVSKNVSPEA